MASFQIKIDGRGVVEAALRSREVRDTIARYTEQVADRARQGGHNVETYNGGNDRARGYVRLAEPNSAVLEAKDRVLGRALGRIE